MSTKLFQTLGCTTTSPYGQAVCDLMAAYFRNRNRADRAQMLRTFSATHVGTTGHDPARWETLARELEDRDLVRVVV